MGVNKVQCFAEEEIIINEDVYSHVTCSDYVEKGPRRQY